MAGWRRGAGGAGRMRHCRAGLPQAPGAALLTALLSNLRACRALIRGQPPPSVAALSRLQRACFLRFGHQPPAALPAGTWAASLRHLATDYDTLLLSRRLLAAAGQLEELAVLGGYLADEPSRASERFWRWCAVHPPLRRLRIELERLGGVGAPFLESVAALRTARPALRVHCEAQAGVVLFSQTVEDFHYHV